MANKLWSYMMSSAPTAAVNRGRNTSGNGATRTINQSGAGILDGTDSEPESKESQRLSRSRASQLGEGASMNSRKYKMGNKARRGSSEHDCVSLDRKNESVAIDTSGNQTAMFRSEPSLEVANIDLQMGNNTLEETLRLQQTYASAHTNDLEDINKEKAQELEELTAKHAKDMARMDRLRKLDGQKIKEQLEELECLKRQKEEADAQVIYWQNYCFKRDMQLQQQEANSDHHIECLQERDELERIITQAQSDLANKHSTLQKMEEKILELTGRGSMPEPRDDNYFSGKFDGLRTSLTQWAIRYFRTKYTITFKDLPQELRGILHKVARDPSGVFSDPKTTRARSQIVCGAVGHLFTHLSSPLLGAPTLNQKIRDLRSNLGGSARDVQRWYGLTSTLISQSPQFKTQQSNGLRTVTETVQKSLQPLADKNMSSQDLYDGLLKIFMEFSHILLEATQQDAIISINYYGQRPGSGVVYRPGYMEDTGYEEDSELLERGAIVNITEFPGLFRQAFDGNGDLMRQSVVISKIKVSCCK